VLSPCLRDLDAFCIPLAHARMVHATRNQGLPGLAATAISAVDTALWDLKARLLAISLADLLGPARSELPAYASGGFTSTGPDALQRELAGYVEAGFRRVKIKVGRDPPLDAERVRCARAAIGPEVELMVDANGAYQRKQALAMAELFAREGVIWFEEPVSSDDLPGLRLLCERAPPGMSIAAGEYGYTLDDFARLLQAGAVDVLQADATRCLGVSGFLRVDALCAAHHVPLSCHCAPALHCQAASAATRLMHLECFRDHMRMEAELFEGVPALRGGSLQLDAARPGLGLSIRADAARRLAVVNA
jgi:L-alanine-DL-glutamate epimerase-like enolase superfamily enzyme